MPSLQEGGDLCEQAKWKLERATVAAIATKRWDAAGVASFALAEVVGGGDAVVAAGALMLHQVRKGGMAYISSLKQNSALSHVPFYDP